MKKIIRYLCIVCLFNIVTASQCHKDKEPISQLPPETQEGKNTFGCLINGEVFVPRGSVGTTPILSSYYQQIYPTASGFVFNISATNIANRPSKDITITVDSVKLYEGIVIELGASTSRGGAYCNNGTSIYYTINGYTGSLKFTKFDEVNQIASGIFWFTGVNSFGETIKVTDGRFDMNYTQ